MNKVYVIRREDYFRAVSLGQLSLNVRILWAGTIWMQILLTEEEKSRYTFPIE